MTRTPADGNGAREALAEALSNELGEDITPSFLRKVDRVLAALYLLGFILQPEE